MVEFASKIAVFIKIEAQGIFEPRGL